MKVGETKHDHEESGDGEFGQHGHDISDEELLGGFVGALTRLNRDRFEYRSRYGNLYRGVVEALGLCGNCESCWSEERWGDNDGMPTDDDLVRLVRELSMGSPVGRCDSRVEKGEPTDGRGVEAS